MGTLGSVPKQSSLSGPVESAPSSTANIHFFTNNTPKKKTRRDHLFTLNTGTAQGIAPISNFHTHEQRILDLVIVQIFQQLGIEKFRSIKIIHILSHVMLLQLRDLILQLKYSMQVLINGDDHILIKFFLSRLGFLSYRSDLEFLSSLHVMKPALSELVGYAHAQSHWICALMEKLASISDHIVLAPNSQTRRMLPPEALLTLFTTLPKSFRETQTVKSSQMDLPSISTSKQQDTPLEMKELNSEIVDQTHPFSEDHTPIMTNKERVNLEEPINALDPNLEISEKLVKSFFHFKLNFDDVHDHVHRQSSTWPSFHSFSLLDYEAFRTGYTALYSPILLSPTSPRSSISAHLSMMSVISPQGPLSMPFSAALNMNVDSEFILNFFQSYPLAFKSENLKSSSKGKGPQFNFEQIQTAIRNFFSEPVSLMSGLANAARRHFDLRGSGQVWLGELCSTATSRRLAHYGRADTGLSSVVHVSSSPTLLKDGSQISIIIRTPRPITTQPTPTFKLKSSASFISTHTKSSLPTQTLSSFISSRQKKKRKKIRPVRTVSSQVAPIKLVFKRGNNPPEHVMPPIPKIKIKFSHTEGLTQKESQIPRIKLKLNTEPTSTR